MDDTDQRFFATVSAGCEKYWPACQAFCHLKLYRAVGGQDGGSKLQIACNLNVISAKGTQTASIFLTSGMNVDEST